MLHTKKLPLLPAWKYGPSLNCIARRQKNSLLGSPVSTPLSNTKSTCELQKPKEQAMSVHEQHNHVYVLNWITWRTFLGTNFPFFPSRRASSIKSVWRMRMTSISPSSSFGAKSSTITLTTSFVLAGPVLLVIKQTFDVQVRHTNHNTTTCYILCDRCKGRVWRSLRTRIDNIITFISRHHPSIGGCRTASSVTGRESLRIGWVTGGWLWGVLYIKGAEKASH